MSESSRAQTLAEHMGLPRDEPVVFQFYRREDYFDAVLRATVEGADEDATAIADAVVTIAERLSSSKPPSCVLCGMPTIYPGLFGYLRGARKTRGGSVIVTCKPCSAGAPADELRDAVIERLGIAEVETSSWAS
jgi:hypothetical protein